LNVVVLHDDSGACVPPQNRIVVVGRPYLSRLFEELHRFAQQVVDQISRPRRALVQMRVGASLAHDAGEPPTIDEAFTKLCRLVTAAISLRGRLG
jgi:hypothetical protein